MEIFNFLDKFGSSILKALPQSPFSDLKLPEGLKLGLGWLNWFFPVSAIIKLMSVWLAAIALLYVVSIAMRWLKMIGD